MTLLRFPLLLKQVFFCMACLAIMDIKTQAAESKSKGVQMSTKVTRASAVNDHAERLTQLSKWYQDELAKITTNETDPKVIKEKIANVVREFERRMKALNHEVVAQNQSAKKPAAPAADKMNKLGKKPQGKRVKAAPLAMQAEEFMQSNDSSIQDEGLKIFIDENGKGHPFGWATVAMLLWSRGERVQAAFSYMVFQIVTSTLARHAKDPSAEPALRESLTSLIGNPIMMWIGADFNEWQRVARLASNFARRLDYESWRPDHIDREAWQRDITTDQKSYEQARAELFADKEKRAGFAKQRKENGLYVGTLSDGGSPIEARFQVRSSGKKK